MSNKLKEVGIKNGTYLFIIDINLDRMKQVK